MQISSLQDIAAWQILLLCRDPSGVVSGADGEVPAFIAVKQPREYRRAVEVRPTHEIEAAVRGYESTCSHISNESIVLNLCST